MNSTTPHSKRSWPINRTLAIIFGVLPIAGLLALSIARAHPGTFALQFHTVALVSASAFILDFGLFLFLVTRPDRTDERIWLTTYLLSISTFSFGEMMVRLSATPVAAVFWENFSTVGFVAGASLYMFVLAYTNRTGRRFSGTAAVLLIMSAFVVFFYGYTDSIWANVPSAMKLFPWGWAYPTAAARPGLDMIALWFDGLSVIALVKMFNFRHHTRNPILRRQSLLMGLAIAFPAFGGAITDAVLPSAGFTLPALANALTAPAAALLIFAALRYRLFNISPAMFSETVLGVVEDSVVVTDDKFNISYLNSKAEALLGIAASSSQQASLLKTIEADDVAKFQQAFAAGPKEGATKVDIDQIQVKGSHDHAVPVRVSSSLLNLSDAKLWVMAMVDITKELQVRSVIEHEVQVRTRELHEARAYLVSSINSLEQGFVLVNAKGVVELVNDEAIKLFHTTDQAMAGKLAGEALHRDEWDHDISKAVEQALSTRKAKQLAVASTSGSFYEVYVTPVVSGGHLLGATVIIQDVTEQKILDRSKDEFFSIASHELRTPLTAIRGNMSMAQEYFGDAMKDGGLKDLVADTHNASVRLIEIVNDFLDSSRLEQGKMVFSFGPVKVAPLVKAVQADLKMLADAQKNVVTVTGLDKLPNVYADEGRLRQILYNVMSNANKYSENATITVKGEAKDHDVRIQVSDTGKGINAEGQKLLFHKFQQAGTSILTRDNTKGTGLGLYISKMLATQMRGDVILEHSEEGKGSTFAIIIPIATGKEKPTAVPAEVAEPTAA